MYCNNCKKEVNGKTLETKYLDDPKEICEHCKKILTVEAGEM